MEDIVVVSVPYTIIEVPPLALAVLKGACEYRGFKCKTVDLGMELYLDLEKNKTLFNDVQLYFYQPTLVENHEHVNIANNFLDKWARILLSYKTKMIGISVFSSFSQTAAFLLSQKLKQLNSNVKIVIGGNGSLINILDTAFNLFKCTKLEKVMTFGDFLKKRKLVDYIIRGDGEDALLKLLCNEKVDETQFYFNDFKKEQYPFANFDDFKLEHYKDNRGKLQLPVYSSKGCIRNCDFCDVNPIQGYQYRFRIGKNIANEIIYLANKYKIYEFYFTDSLANGSIKNLKEMASALAEYNKTAVKKIKWNAQGWISRPPGQIKPELYQLLSQSGLETVSIGVESGSNYVLNSMDKKTTIEGLYYDLDYFKKFNIKFTALMIVGHWAERWEDFLQTADLFYNFAKYVRADVLQSVVLGQGYAIETDQPAWKNRHETSELIAESRTIWWTKKNPELTLKERYSRWLILSKLLHKLKIPRPTNDEIKLMYINMQNDIKIAKTWYPEKIGNLNLNISPSEYYMENFEEFYDLIKSRVHVSDNFEIELDIEVGHTVGKKPGLSIAFNDKKIFKDTFEQGNHKVRIEKISLLKKNLLSMEFFNKTNLDTKVDRTGNIIKDKYIKINRFVINGVDIISDIDFYHKYVKYFEYKELTQSKTGFWIPGSKLEFDFPKNFNEYYNLNSMKNAIIDEYIVTRSRLPGNRVKEIEPEEFFEKILNNLKQLPV